MSKRFTDTEKWNKYFVRGLQAPYKLLWVYVLDECGAAGIWDVDIEVAQVKLGVKLKKETALQLFKDKIILLDNGKKWFIPSFIDFQYGQLAANNRAHTKIIFLLEKFLLLDENLRIKGHTSPLQGAKVEDKDKVEDKVEEMVEEEGNLPREEKKINMLVMPFSSEQFIEKWQQWKTYKAEQWKFTYKSISTEQAAVNELVKLSKGHEPAAIEIILQSIANGWKGFFEIKNNSNGKATTKNFTTASPGDMAAAVAAAAAKRKTDLW